MKISALDVSLMETVSDGNQYKIAYFTPIKEYITNPYTSPCGRFSAHPSQYGMTNGQAAELALLNQYLDAATTIALNEGMSYINQCLGLLTQEESEKLCDISMMTLQTSKQMAHYMILVLRRLWDPVEDPVEDLADEFGKVLHEWIGTLGVKEVVKHNREEPLAGVCHSHDLCDANEAMEEACRRLGVTGDTDGLCVSAWTTAKQRGFSRR